MISIALACLLSPAPYARQWQSPSYRDREAATARLEKLGLYAYPICSRLARHRDAEVRNRARGVFAKLYEAKRPLASAEFPRQGTLGRAASYGLRPWLAGRVQKAIDDEITRRYIAWLGPAGHGQQAYADRERDDRDFALILADHLVWKGCPPRLVQAWVDRAALLEKRDSVRATLRSFSWRAARWDLEARISRMTRLRPMPEPEFNPAVPMDENGPQ